MVVVVVVVVAVAVAASSSSSSSNTTEQLNALVFVMWSSVHSIADEIKDIGQIC